MRTRMRLELDEWIGAGGPVLGIKPQDLTTFMNSGANRTDYMIIDLRTDQDFAPSGSGFAIRGARHMPLLESPTLVSGSVNYRELCCKDKSNQDREAKQKE
ncbi:hypothetical protein DH86_00004160 [Scytalidium sp. 3C]|nr:hypothetical protein DH86_00004160 [Scytalidium sp. 3C]